jgi:hypothetical protein
VRTFGGAAPLRPFEDATPDPISSCVFSPIAKAAPVPPARPPLAPAPDEPLADIDEVIDLDDVDLDDLDADDTLHHFADDQKTIEV